MRVKKATVWHPELLCFEKYGDKLNNEESGFHRVVYVWNTGKCIWLCRSVSVCNAALTPILTALWNDILKRKRGRKEKQATFSPLFLQIWCSLQKHGPFLGRILNASFKYCLSWIHDIHIMNTYNHSTVFCGSSENSSGKSWPWVSIEGFAFG